MSLLLVSHFTDAVALPLTNENFDGATTVADPLPFNNSVSTPDATTEADDTYYASFAAGDGSAYKAWYSYTSGADEFIGAVADSNFDRTISFDGTIKLTDHVTAASNYRPL